MAGQTINDRLLAARHSIAGQGLAKSVCKATTEEMIGPKKKHLDYLVQCTNEPNVSIPQLANLLIERSQNASWIVVYKALITVHHMMCYGNERFTQYLASSNSTFQLSNFLDRSGLPGVTGAKVGYDMSPFIRRYARYLNEKALSYRTVAFDFCKVRRGKEDGTLRTMNAEKLLKTLPTLQNQLDALLEFDCAANNLNNGVINMCFMLLFRDLIRLFACYNDGVINLLEKYFDMNKKQCRDALDLYKKFLIRMDRVAEFLKVAENMGIDKGDIPDLTKAPSSLLDALEQHLASVEGKKTPTQSANNARDVKFGVTALSSTSSSFGTAATNGRLDNGIDESLKQQILAEEEAAMNQYKSKIQSPNNATNPFLSNNNPAPDFAVKGAPASEDLLQLNNPFSDGFVEQRSWITNGNLPTVPTTTTTTTSLTFVSESNFSSVFGNTDSSTAAPGNLNPFLSDCCLNELVCASADMQQPVPNPPTPTPIVVCCKPPRPPPPNILCINKNSQFISCTEEQGTFDGFGSILQPANPNQTSANMHMHNIKNAQQAQTHSSAVLTGDLETSLASLAENLSINKGPPPVKGVQWNSPKNGAKPSQGWSPQPMAATTGANYRPMGQGMPTPIYTPMQQQMGLRPAMLPGMPTTGPQNTNTQMASQSLLFH